MLKVIYGDEPYMIRYTVKEALKGISEIDVLKTDTFNAEVIHFLNTCSLFSGNRAAVVSVNDLKELDEKLMETVLSHAPAGTLLIVCASADERTSLFKKLNQQKVLVNCKKVDCVAKLPALLKKVAAAQNASFTEGALEEFLRRENYQESEDITIDNLISDLYSVIALGSHITVANVVAVVKENLVSKVFSLMQYIQCKDLAALSKQSEVIGSDCIGALSAILREYRISYRRAIGISKEYSKFNLKRGTCEQGIYILTDALEKAKGSSFPNELLLKETLMKLAVL